MSSERDQAGVGNTPRPKESVSDRCFVASFDGTLQGPFNASQLCDVRPRPGDLIWRVGQTDWSAWSESMELAEAVEPSSAAEPASFWTSLTTRSKAARTAAALEVQAVRGRRSVAAARQDLDTLCREIGRVLIDSDLAFSNAAVTRVLVAGRDLTRGIDAADAAIAHEQHLLDRVDPKSPAADRSRTAIASRRKLRTSLVSQLSATQLQLGRAVQEHGGGDHAILVGLAERHRAASDALDAASAGLKRIEQERLAANAQIGTSLRKAIAVAAVVLVGGAVLGLTLMPRGAAVPDVAAAVSTTQAAATRASVVEALAVEPVATTAPAVVPGLTREQLKLASALVVTSWKAYPNVTQTCTGSAGALTVGPNGLMELMTNRHVLNLDELVKAKSASGLYVGEYEVKVKFPSGRVCKVLWVRPESTGVDIAILQVDARTLQDGVDYVRMPPASLVADLQPGDEVVAIGNPAAGDTILENTQTFGHVSALRDDTVEGVTTKYVQTDAAINHGNSGGPLMLRKGDRYLWAGVNTLAGSPGQGLQGLNFAIDARQAAGLKFWTYNANAAGIASFLSDACHIPASTYTP